MEHQYTIPELKVLHAAGVPIQFGTDWAALTAPEWTNHPTSYRPDPAALVFRSPEGVLTLGHSREGLLAAQAAGLLLEQFVEGTGWVRWNSRNKWCVSDRSAPYRLAPGQPAWPAPEAEPALPRSERAAFEAWLDRTRPSGDSEAVHMQWLESLAYIDFLGEPEAASAYPWAREKRALAAGLRVQCRCAAVLDMPWHTIGDSTKHLLKGDGGGSWADPNYAFRVHPNDEGQMQAIERGEQPKPVLIGCDYATGTYEAWLATRPARLAARKPVAVGAARFNAFRDMAGWTSQSGGDAGYRLHDALQEHIGAWPIHNPDARMATVPGHEKGMP